MMNDVLMNKLTDAQDYKHIADEVYKAACTNAYTVDGYVEIDKSLCFAFTKDALLRKAPLIELLSKHPNWDDKEKRIHLTTTESRAADPGLAHTMLRKLGDVLMRNTAFVAETIGIENAQALTKLGEVLYYTPSVRNDLINNFGVPKELEAVIKNLLPDAHITAGTKCTKAVIRLLRQYGVPEKKYPVEYIPESIETDPETGEIINGIKTDQYLWHEEFWRAKIASFYTQFADAVNPLEIKRQVLISVNPADFLLMSRGNSWQSCHDIRHSGGWQAGCSSYAFDSQTIIMYTTYGDTPYEDITMTPKLSRQLIFWNGKILYPCRIYPQDTDGNSKAYSDNRQIIEEVMATCLGVPNLWKKVGDCACNDFIFHNGGRQYRDYTSCTYSFKTYSPSEFEVTEADMEFSIGSDDAFCLACGNTLDIEGAIICGDCAEENSRHCDCCGDRLGEDEGTWIGDTLYCDFCRDDRFTWCERCEEWEEDGQYVWTFSRWRGEYEEWWCDNCVDDHAFYCEGSGRYYDNDHYTHIYTEDGYTLEESWADENAYHCEQCGAWYYSDDYIKYREDAGMWLCDDCYEAWLEEHKATENSEEVAY